MSSRTLADSPKRDRQQARRFARLAELAGIRSTHDVRDLIDDRIVKVELVEEGVEAAARPAMRERNVRDVVRLGAQRLRLRAHLVGGRVEEGRSRVDESPHQPRAGESIDLRTFARHPARRAGRIEIGARFHRRMTGLDPGFDAAFENEGGIAHRIQRVCDGAARLAAVLAIGDDRARSRQRSSPLADLLGIAAQRAWNEARPCGEVGALAHVEEHGRIRQTESRKDGSGETWRRA